MATTEPSQYSGTASPATTTASPATTTQNNLTIHKVSESVWLNSQSVIEDAISNATANEIFFINAQPERFVEIEFAPECEILSNIVSRVLTDLTLSESTITTASFNDDTLTFTNTSLSNLLTIGSNISNESNKDNFILNNGSGLTGTLQTYKGSECSGLYKVIEKWENQLG